MILDQFSVAAGSVPGFRHWKAYRNNQDGISVSTSEHSIAAFVCDGCSQGLHSEVGANLMARFFSRRAISLLDENRVLKRWNLADPDDRQSFHEQLRQDALSYMRRVIAGIDDNPTESIRDFFLFTVVGAVVTTEMAFVFTLGDGIYQVNGDYTDIDEDNLPTYIGYALLDADTLKDFDRRLTFEERQALPSCGLENLKIGSDGIEVLNRRADEVLKDETPQCGIDQFNAPRYTNARTAVQKRLTVIGLLNKRGTDDMSLVTIQRRETQREVPT